MLFSVFLPVFIAAVVADTTSQQPESTPAPVIEPSDLYSAINNFTVNPGSVVSALESWVVEIFSIEFAEITSSAASVSSSLDLLLSTADAAISTSINSQLSLVAANVSRASVAMETARAIANRTFSPTPTPSTSTGGVACETAAVGIGALVGGMAILAYL
ncbi:hypothetical protein J7T55_005798 [Diaporthe amygdali]|uniref:uncharacterized protein n=1 Tax=Phomopsis amygdali TaxID=1214568 RepID=UPI0022FE6573|nr:uncharacterized protein J7T55_005798 [Diaporthe amygdali]KAJ0124460.1 hypothetical protein J7T55_005798 [Diaporthe amygdali]